MKLKPIKGLDVVQVRSNITGRVLGERRVSPRVNKFGLVQVANSILKPLLQGSRDVYITVLDTDLKVRSEFTIE